MASKTERGITSRDTGVFIPHSERVPHNPANLHKSKTQFIADEAKRRENDVKAKQFRNELEVSKKIIAETKADTLDVKSEKKKAGRPKKIE